MGARGPRRLEIGPKTQHGEHGEGSALIQELPQKFDGRRVAPVEVLHEQHRGSVPRGGGKPRARGLHDALTQQRRALCPRRIPLRQIDREERGEVRDGLVGGKAHRFDTALQPRQRGGLVGFPLTSFDPWAPEACGQQLAERLKFALSRVWIRVGLEPEVRLAGERIPERAQQTRLPDARLTRHEHGLAVSVARAPPAVAQEFDLALAARERGEPVRVDVKAAARRGPEHAMGPHRGRDAFQRECAEVARLKLSRYEPMRGFADHDFARAGDPLQPGCQVRCLAHGDLFGGSRGGDVAHHGKAGVDADSHLKRAFGEYRIAHRELSVERADPAHDVERRAHRADGRIFQCSGIAEVDHQAVAQWPRDESAPRRDAAAARLLISFEHRGEVFRIRVLRERGRSHHVDEHHRELAALGGGAGGLCRAARGRVRGIGVHPDQNLALASRDPLDRDQFLDEGLEVGVLEVGLAPQSANRDASVHLQVRLRPGDGVEKAHAGPSAAPASRRGSSLPQAGPAGQDFVRVSSTRSSFSASVQVACSRPCRRDRSRTPYWGGIRIVSGRRRPSSTTTVARRSRWATSSSG